VSMDWTWTEAQNISAAAWNVNAAGGAALTKTLLLLGVGGRQ
jgi:hypothetical protein